MTVLLPSIPSLSRTYDHNNIFISQISFADFLRIHWLPDPEGGPLEPVNVGAAAQDQLRQQQQQRQEAQHGQVRRQRDLQLQQEQRDQQHEARLKRRRDLRESFRPLPRHAHSFESRGNKYNKIKLGTASDDDDDDDDNDDDNNENEMKGHILVGRDTRVNRGVTLDDDVAREEKEKVDRNYSDIQRYRNMYNESKTMKHKAAALIPAIGKKNENGHKMSTSTTPSKGTTQNEILMQELWESDQYSEISTPTTSLKDPACSEDKSDALPSTVPVSITHTSDGRRITEYTWVELSIEDQRKAAEDELIRFKDHPHYKYLLDDWNEKQMAKQTGDSFPKQENNEIFKEDPNNREMFAREIRRYGDHAERSLSSYSSREAFSVNAMSNTKERCREIDMTAEPTDMKYVEDSKDILYPANSPKNENLVQDEGREESDMFSAYKLEEIAGKSEVDIDRSAVSKKYSDWSDKWSDNLSEKVEERKADNKYDYLADMHDSNDSDHENEDKGHEFANNDSDTDDDEGYNENADIAEEEEDVDDPLGDPNLNQNPNANANLNLPDRGDLDIHIAFDEVLGIRPNRPWCVLFLEFASRFIFSIIILSI